MKNIYQRNIKWLVIFSPFTLLPFSGAYVTPFFLHQGLSQAGVFLLQSVYSVTYLTWNIPSGYLADKYGHAMAIKIGAPIAAMAMIFYGFGGHFWQFALCEMGLAIGEGLMQGADRALLIESLAHEKRDDEFVKLSQRIGALGWIGAAAGVPLAMVLVSKISLGATLTADGILIAIGAVIATVLKDLPKEPIAQEAVEISAWLSLRQLVAKADVRWLLALTISLGAAPYLAFWMAAPYYTKLGIPVIFFGLIFAIRSAWKAWLSHKFHKTKRVQATASAYAGLTAVVYFAMATQQIWLLWTVLGHDVIEALQSQPILKIINGHIANQYRATLNSAVDLAQRFTYMLAGPLLGLLVDSRGLWFGFVVAGICCSGVAFLAITRLTKLQAF